MLDDKEQKIVRPYWRCNKCGKFTNRDKLKLHSGYDTTGRTHSYFQCAACSSRQQLHDWGF